MGQDTGHPFSASTAEYVCRLHAGKQKASGLQVLAVFLNTDFMKKLTFSVLSNDLKNNYVSLLSVIPYIWVSPFAIP